MNGVHKIQRAPIADARRLVGRNIRGIEDADRRSQGPAAGGKRHIPAGLIGRLMAGNTTANDVENSAALDAGRVLRQLSGGQRLSFRQENKSCAAEAQKNRGGNECFIPRSQCR